VKKGDVCIFRKYVIFSMRRILLAPDKFKGCLTAARVCDAMTEGIRQVDPSIEIDSCPMADGGEGTVEALVRATGGTIVTQRVTGPLPRMKVDAPIGILGDGFTSVVEMSSASGLQLLKPNQYDPLRTTTYGTGELLREASRLGARTIILGIGGSATVDGGIGAAQACGAMITLNAGGVYSDGGRRLSGGDLVNLRSISFMRPRELRDVEIVVACDVGNPLLGPDGAAAVFGPQKGASPQDVRKLESGLSRLVEKTGREDLATRPGAGAGGGLGFGMMAFFDATLRPGVEIVLEYTRLRDRLRGADLCLTGEGKLDAQSLSGKTPIGVASICRELGIPCIAIAGALDIDSTQSAEAGLTAAFSICPRPISIEQSMRDAATLLASTTARVVATCRAAR
jgi:glycerate kinase